MGFDEKAVVKIDADGGVLKCAKGLASADCGYSPEKKVCGKCGAMAVEVKMVPVSQAMSGDTSDVDAMMAEGEGADFERALAELDAQVMKRVEKRMAGKKPKKKAMVADDSMLDDEVALEPTEEEMAGNYNAGKGWGPKKAGMRYKKPAGAPMVEGEMDDEMEEDDSMIDDDAEMMEGDEMEMGYEDEGDEEPMVPAAQKMRKGGKGGSAPAYAIPDMEALRLARLRKMGTKSADVGINGYLCAIDRKVYPGSTTVCDDCPGGCAAEKGMPGLLHVEGLAEKMFNGDVIDSGYSAQADMFVIDVKAADGAVKEVFIDGTTAEVLGFHRLDDSIFEQKSLIDDIHLIDFNEAAEIAVKTLPGEVFAVEPDIFEGFDVYKVQLDGVDGKSYDVHVALDGEVLAWDAYPMTDSQGSDETADIEAEAAEIELKRAFSDERRMALAEEGSAMPDGSFPIVSEADLRNAIKAHGRASDIEAAKRHIKKRAQALGMESLIPTEWTAGQKSVVVEDGEASDFLKSLLEFDILAADDETSNN